MYPRVYKSLACSRSAEGRCSEYEVRSVTAFGGRQRGGWSSNKLCSSPTSALPRCSLGFGTPPLNTSFLCHSCHGTPTTPVPSATAYNSTSATSPEGHGSRAVAKWRPSVPVHPNIQTTCRLAPWLRTRHADYGDIDIIPAFLLHTQPIHPSRLIFHVPVCSMVVGCGLQEPSSIDMQDASAQAEPGNCRQAE